MTNGMMMPGMMSAMGLFGLPVDVTAALGCAACRISCATGRYIGCAAAEIGQTGSGAC